METGSLPLAALRQLLTRPVAAVVEQRCDLCRETLADDHRHLFDARARHLLCVCGTCLAAREGSASGVDGSALRPVPRSDQHRPFTIDREQWEALDSPVDLVFFFLNSSSGRPVACYPGPAGVTESVLSLDAWSSLVAANLWIESLAPDVEAVLVRRINGAYSAVVVPIDRCYALAGLIRTAWSGMRGGDEVHRVIERFFTALVHTCGGQS